MNNVRYILLIIFLCFTTTLFGQAPAIQWKKCFGGSGNDIGLTIVESPTGGYFVAGHTESHDGDVQSNNGLGNVWLVRIDTTGNITWEKSYGGSFGYESAYDMQMTNDGGLIIVGEASSNDGNVTGYHSGSGPDIWVVKTDSSGNLLWQKCLGGAQSETGSEIIETMDGNYILIGTTESLSGDGDLSFVHSPPDTWVVKLDNIGNIIWEKTFGGYDLDFGNSILEGDTNEFYLCTTSSSLDSFVLGNHGEQDILVTKINSTQNIIWQKNFGGSSNEYIGNIYFDSNYKLRINANTESNDFDITNFNGSADIWGLIIDSTNLLSSRCFGGNGHDNVHSSHITFNDGTIIAGHSNSSSLQSNCLNTFMYDYFILKLDSLGNFEWSKCLGGSADDVANDAIPTSDGGYIAVGSTESNDYDVSGNHGGKDMWVVKLAPAGVNVPELSAAITDFTTFENSNGALHLNFSAEASASLKLSLFDLTGREVFSEKYSCISGMNSHNTSALSLSPGIYVLQLSDGEGMMVKKIFVNGRN